MFPDLIDVQDDKNMFIIIAEDSNISRNPNRTKHRDELEKIISELSLDDIGRLHQPNSPEMTFHSHRLLGRLDYILVHKELATLFVGILHTHTTNIRLLPNICQIQNASIKSCLSFFF